MKSLKQLAFLIVFPLLITTACGSTDSVAPTPIPIVTASPTAAPALVASEQPTVVEQATFGATPVGIETNLPPVTVSVPQPSSQPAASPRYRAGDPISLDEIHMVDATTGWGLSGAVVLVTADGAQTWSEVTPPQDLSSSAQIKIYGAFLDSKNAWVVFSIDNQIPSDAVIWHTTDRGQTWIASAPLDHGAYGDQVWIEFSMLDAVHIWLMVRGVYAGAGIHYAAQFFRTTDGGLTWLPLVGDIGVDYTGMAFADPNYGMLAWQTTGAYAPAPPEYAWTSDGAVNWEARTLPPPAQAPDLFDVLPYCEPFQPHMLSDHSTRVLVACFDEYDPPHTFSSYLYASDDRGSTWISYPLPENALASADTLFFFDSSNALLLGRDIYRSTDGGQTWLYVRSVNWEGQFTFVDSQTGWAIARANDEAALVKTSSGGDSWIQIKPVIAK